MIHKPPRFGSSELFRLVVIAVACIAILASCGNGESRLDVAAPKRAPVESVDAGSTDASDAGQPAAEETAAQRIERLHRDSIVFDAHCDTLLRVLDDGADLAARSEEGHIDLPRMVEGGLDAQAFAVWVSPEHWGEGKAMKRATAMIDAFDEMIADNPGEIERALDAEDVRRIVAKGKRAAMLGVEGGHAIENDPSNLAVLYDRGVRYMTLTWWKNTDWADGSGDKPKWRGLNDLGREIVREMNRLGMIVDVSHASDDTFRDVLEITNAPVIASHSNARAVADHHRNLDDDMLRALAKNGGVVGINFVPGFLDAGFEEAFDKLRGKLEPKLAAIERKHKKNRAAAMTARWDFLNREARAISPVSLDRVADHIDHLVAVAGIDHVGLGSDFDGFGVRVTGLEDCTGLPLLTAKLVERGYRDDDIAKIHGGNFLRVFDRLDPSRRPSPE